MRRTLCIFFLVWTFFDAHAQNTDCKCCTERHSDFDFWVGEWEVTDPTGAVVGTNSIDKIQDACVVRENWKGTSGNTGISLNFYNSETGQWEQLWVDNSGTHLKLKGTKKENQMILWSDDFVHSDGKRYKNRITWTANEDGTVHQLWELVAGDNAVKVAFDGLYKKVE